MTLLSEASDPAHRERVVRPAGPVYGLVGRTLDFPAGPTGLLAGVVVMGYVQALALLAGVPQKLIPIMRDEDTRKLLDACRGKTFGEPAG